MSASRLAPGQARKAVADYASLIDLSEQLLNDVLLCVSEAVSNVVFHAYRDAESAGTLEIEASVDGDLRICVRDQGSGFAMRSDSPGSGLGLPIITKLTRTFHIRTTSDGGGTEVIMRFALPSP
jgi:serine/threonine-protein kinase RsbW